MKCKYCHTSAGLFRAYHKECQNKHDNAIIALREEYDNKFTSKSKYPQIAESSSNIVASGFISDVERENILVDSFRRWASSKASKYEEILEALEAFPNELKRKVVNSSEVKVLWDSLIPAALKKEIEKGNLDKNVIARIKNDAKRVGLDDAILELTIEEEFEARLDNILEDGIIDDEEEISLSNFIKETGFNPNEGTSSIDTYHKFIQALILKDFSKEGESHRLDLTQSSILLGKGEYPIWAYNGIEAYQDKTGKKYVGGNSGVSFKICKGVYYRTGASKGHSVDYDYTESIGRGSLVITNKAIYFVGAKTIKLIISKIVTLEPYSDGIKIQKEGVRNNSFTFVGFDSWFMMNLLPMLNN